MDHVLALAQVGGDDDALRAEVLDRLRHLLGADLRPVLQEGQVPQESLVASGKGVVGRASPNNDGVSFIFPLMVSQTMYCAKAIANGKAPLPCFPKNNKA